MDRYGIGSAASMALHLYENASRRTGRTERMLDAVGGDDVIVCRHHKEADRLRRLLKERNKPTKVVAVEHADEIYHKIQPRARGRVVFDHGWVHQFFVDAIKGAEDDLRRLTDSLSSKPEDREAEQANMMNIQRRGNFPLEI